VEGIVCGGGQHFSAAELMQRFSQAVRTTDLQLYSEELVLRPGLSAAVGAYHSTAQYAALQDSLEGGLGRAARVTQR